MEQICALQGVEEGRLWREGQSRNTRQNAAFCLALLAAAEGAGVHFGGRLCVVTEWPHLFRAWLVFSVLNWRGARRGLWRRRVLKMVPVPGPSSAWSLGRFLLHEGAGVLADGVRCWFVPLPEIDPAQIVLQDPVATKKDL
jgi:hypothetical protein